MNAYTSSEELALLPANRTSYVTRFAPARPKLGLVERIRAFFQRQAAISEMTQLSDRELRDIGLNRSDLEHVFDHGFVSRLAD